MCIKKFEMLHGAVLAKLVRSDNPITLRMIETDVSQAWSAYTLNAEVYLYIKNSVSPKKRINGETPITWTFTFASQHLTKLRELSSQKQIYLV